MGEAPGRLLQRPDKIEAPDSEGPDNWNCLQSLGQEVGLLCIELASLAGPNDLGGVFHSGRPVETLSRGVSYQRLRCLVMVAAHKDARGAALVHLAVDENKSLGMAS